MTSTKTRHLLTIASCVAALVVAAGCGKSATSTSSAPNGTTSATAGLVAASPPATGPYTQPIVWALYRETSTLDPIYAFDYPENTATAAMCDTLLRQPPTGVVQARVVDAHLHQPDQARVHPPRRGQVLGRHPLTSADVVYSLQRQMDPKLGGFYAAVFRPVKSIKATGATGHDQAQAARRLAAGRAVLDAGVHHREGLHRAARAKVRHPRRRRDVHRPVRTQGLELRGRAGARAQRDYWNTALQPKASEIDFKGVPPTRRSPAALKTGEIAATTRCRISTLDQLKADNLKVYQGPRTPRTPSSCTTPTAPSAT